MLIWLDEGTVYHCKTEKDAKDLLRRLEAVGFRWEDGFRLTYDNKLLQYRYRKHTCYMIVPGRLLSYGRKGFFISEGHKIIRYKAEGRKK